MPKKSTAAEPATERDELKLAADALIDEVVNGTDDGLNSFVTRLTAEAANAHRVHGTFKRWSLANRMYLEAQRKRRHASVKGLFAGVAQWQKMGRAVREDQLGSPYFIFGSPVIARQRNNAAGNAANQPQNAQPAQHQPQPAQQGQLPVQNAPAVAQVWGYRKPPRIEVFDWTQTYSTDPDYVEPRWDVPLAAGDFTTLRALVAAAPVPVHLREDIAGMNENGWLDATGITVDSSQGVGNQIWVMTHELAHHYLGHLEQLTDTRRGLVTETVDGEYGTETVDDVRARCEQEAAVAQWFAMRMLGLDEAVGNDITKAAAAYLRTWLRTDDEGNLVPVEGRKLKRKLLGQRLDAGLDAANQIVAAFQEAIAPAPQLATAS